MALFKVFSKLSLPKLGLISIESVPPDSEEVRTFLANSFSDISELCFTNETVIEASKYIEALKIAATKNVEAFGVYNTRFSQKEFEGLVSSAKGIKWLSLRWNIIEMDEPADFGNMEGSWVETIILDTCGEENYSNWRDNPIRFGVRIRYCFDNIKFRELSLRITYLLIRT